MTTSRALPALALSAALVLAACSARQEEPGSPFDGTRGSEDVLLTVQNHDFQDATIHVFWNGFRTRAGMVTGKTTETFRMPWRSEWAYLEVDFIGSREDYRTEQIPVLPGDHLDFVIQPGLSSR